MAKEPSFLSTKLLVQPDSDGTSEMPNADEAIALETVLDALFDGAYVVDRQRRIRKWNAGASFLTGFRSDEVVERCCSDNILVHVDECGTELCKSGCPLQKTLDDGKPRQAAVYLRHKFGYRLPVTMRILPLRGAGGEVSGAIEIFRVVGEPEFWKARIAELEQLAFIDPLTGIPNRRFVESEADRLLQQLDGAGEPFVMALLDVDHFKSANDEHGHDAGDRVLRAAGQTLLNCIRTRDIVGRWGGDEFMLLLPRTEMEGARQILQRARVLIAGNAVSAGERLVRMTVSIGAVLVNRDTDRSSLLGRVDAELYRAKQQGRNCCCMTW